MKKFIKNILKGIIIGIANIIPGVSGGTMMVSMGVYDTIIGAINQLFRKLKESMKTLLPFIIGMAIGIIGLSFCMEYFFDEYPMQTGFLFIGLVFGGMPMLFDRLKGKEIPARGALLFVLFFVLIILLQVFGGHGEEKAFEINVLQMVLVLLAGVVASATMVIPGVSGSMILMTMGYYVPIISEVSSFIKSLLSFDIGGLLHGFAILIPFGIGVIIGILGISRLIDNCLKRNEVVTYCAILGMVFTSPITIMMGVGLISLGAMDLLTTVLTFTVGYITASRLSVRA